MKVDIVVPVWNRPVETRNCLVSLISHTPDARLILVDNGSERETEALLEEFADALNDRALLMRTETNRGFVKGANLGLARADAPLVALVRQTSEVAEGWLDPIVRFAAETSKAGILVPPLTRNGGKAAADEAQRVMEIPAPSFAALVFTRAALEAVGLFDETLDGGDWCLKDLARRAYAADFRTIHVPGPPVRYAEEILFGSGFRREQVADSSRNEYERRWGSERTFVIHYGAESTPEVFSSRRLLREMRGCGILRSAL